MTANQFLGPYKESVAAMKNPEDELQRYLELFKAAFDELHNAIVTQVKTPSQYVGPKHDYPVMTMLESGFPSFREVGFYNDDAPRDYVATVRPDFAGLLSGIQSPKIDLPESAKLAAFLKNHGIGKQLNLGRFDDTDIGSDWFVEGLVSSAVERYLHLHGIDAPVEAKSRDNVILPLVRGTVYRNLELRLVVPITMTNFEVDHFALTETTYVTRLPRKLQLARSRISTLGSGAERMVVGAATHAFVSKDWQLKPEDTFEVSASLRKSSADVVDAIDSFLGALRIATGETTGYAQIVWVPRHWALSYFCDLPSVYGTTLRQYPSEYDDYGWVRQGLTVTDEQLHEVRRIYRTIVDNKSEAVRLAIKRLNGCLTRTDASDAILDATIGLELLLGDDQNQSLSYKLRLRAGALALVHVESPLTAAEVSAKVKRLYDARSAIVHGRRKKQSRKASEPADTSHTEDRLVASDLLRFVLNVLLTHPEYQHPAKIDEGLLLRGDAAADTQKTANSKRNRRKGNH